MKTLILAFVVMWTATSFGYDVQLLTPEQIKKLSKEDQVRYLRGLQRILAGMVQQTPFMAERMNSNGRFPSSDEEFDKQYKEWQAQQSGTTSVGSPGVINQLKAEEPEQATPPAPPASSATTKPVPSSTVKSTDLPKLDSQPTPSTSSETTTTTTSSTPSSSTVTSTVTPSTPSGTSTTSTPATPSAPAKNTTVKAVKNAQGGIDYAEVEATKDELKGMFPGKAAKTKASKPATPASTPKPSSRVSDAEALSPNESIEPKDKTSKPAPTANNKNQKTDEKKPASTNEAKKESKTAQSQDEEQTQVTGSRKHFRCMYSGWVIEGPDCTGPQKIPDWLAIDGMSAANKGCPAGQVVCMPLIFGLQIPDECKTFQQKGCPEKAKPICVKRGAWPTVDCYRMAGNNKSRGTRVALELITEVVPNQYARYQSLFKDLCDEDQIKSNPFADKHKGKARSKEQARRIRDDISKTCEWASKQVADLNSMNNIDKLMNKDKKSIPAPETRDPRSKGRR